MLLRTSARWLSSEKANSCPRDLQISVMRHRLPSEKLTKIKGIARLDGVLPSALYHSFVDSDARMKWDRNLLDMKVAFDLGR